MSKKILIAGTRLTGESPHIGTYYGWIFQIKRALEQHDIIIMISDYQSLDMDYQVSYYEAAQNLKKVYKYFLPNVPVIIESEITDILKLGFLIQKNFKNKYYRRIMPIKKQIEETGETNFHVLFYPALMLADILAIDAKVAFDKPEGKFQHSEVINHLIGDFNKKFDLDVDKLETFSKQHINILSLDGTGPMKRNRSEHGVIEVYNINEDYIYHCLKNTSKKVIESIINSINYAHHSDLMDKMFLKELSHKIFTDINNNIDDKLKSEDDIIENANKNVARYIKILGG